MKIEERLFRKFGRMYPKDAYVFRQGDTGQEMYYILMGNMRVEKTAGQIKKVLAEMGPGEYFGEMAALIEAPRTASVQATEDSNVAVIDSDHFSQPAPGKRRCVSFYAQRILDQNQGNWQRPGRTYPSLDEIDYRPIFSHELAHAGRRRSASRARHVYEERAC